MLIQRKRQELDKIFASTNSSYGVSLILNLGLDEDLELFNLDKVVLNSDLLGVWASIDFSPRYQFTANEIEYKLMLRNDGNLEWPENKTKLINDKDSDIECEDYILNNLHKD